LKIPWRKIPWKKALKLVAEALLAKVADKVKK
jgi:hypothetical protein